MSEGGAESPCAKPLIYTEYAVAPSIANVVQCGWSFVANDNLQGAYAHHVVPDGCFSLVYRVGCPPNPGLLIVSGPRIRELRIDIFAKNRFWGIRFWPDSGGAILGLDPIQLRERSDLLAMHAPELAKQLGPELDQCLTLELALTAFHNFLASRQVLLPPEDIAIRKAILAINCGGGAIPIAEIAATVDLSPRQLQRRFQARVGLTPKEYSRIRRMRVALSNAIEERPKDWATIAAETGYADQAHLTRDAASLTGLSPSGFEARIRPIEHQNFEP